MNLYSVTRVVGIPLALVGFILLAFANSKLVVAGCSQNSGCVATAAMWEVSGLVALGVGALTFVLSRRRGRAEPELE